MRRIWTPADLAVLERNYQRRGCQWIADRLGRTYSAVQQKASQLGIIAKVPPRGMLAAWDVAVEAGVSYTAVCRVAKRAGVLVRLGKTATRISVQVLVPEVWAREYIAAHSGAEEHADWWSVQRAAERWGFSRAGVRKALHAGSFARRIDLVVRTATIRGETRIHPDDAVLAERRLREARAKARRMVPVKNLVVDCGVTLGALLNLLRRRGWPLELLLGRGGWAMYTTPEVADLVLKRYGVRRAA